MPQGKPQIEGSEQQLAIWDAFVNRQEHIVIRALAGTGKTTTGVEGLRPIVARGDSAAFLAFNKSIATELAAKVPSGAKAQTFHSAGFGACRNQFGQLEIDGDRVYKMLPERMPRHAKSTIIKLVSICKNTLCDGHNKQDLLDLCAQYDIDLYGDRGPEGQQAGWHEETADLILDSVPQILEQCKTPTGSIDFDDMIWLPVVWRLPIKKYDFLVVDESQDLNATQQELCFMIGRRIIVVGDEHQAIYGFRGASVKSMSELEERLAEDRRGCITLPLTVTRRCPVLVTAIAREIVHDFKCLPDAPAGYVCLGDGYLIPKDYDVGDPIPNYEFETLPYPDEVLTYHFHGDDTPHIDTEVSGTHSCTDLCVTEKVPGTCKDSQPKRGDMVLCRTNAPLVQLAYQLIRINMPCKIQGRDFGKGLENLVKQLVPVNASTPDLIRALVAYSAKERAKIEAAANGHEARMLTQLGNLQDKEDCILALCEGLSTAAEVVSRITLLFQDVNKTTGDSSNYVLLSSIHRAKGLEAHTVRIIHPELLPHPMARLGWQKEQERNLKYVAITRSLHTVHLHNID